MFGVAALAAQFLAFGRPRFALAAQEYTERTAPREDHVAFRAVEHVAVVEAVQAVGRERIVLVDQQPAVGILVVTFMLSGYSLAWPCSSIRPPRAVIWLGQRINAQSPGGHVEVVNAVVADLAVAIVAKHPPRAVKSMRIEGVHGRRTEPAIVIDARRRRAVGQPALRLRPHFGRPRSGDFHFADDSVGQQLAGLAR